jgi:hypothetical protein
LVSIPVDGELYRGDDHVPAGDARIRDLESGSLLRKPVLPEAGRGGAHPPEEASDGGLVEVRPIPDVQADQGNAHGSLHDDGLVVQRALPVPRGDGDGSGGGDPRGSARPPGGGRKYIQIDEPAIHARPEEIEIAIEAMGIVTAGLTAKTISHICYGDFDVIYPALLALPVDMIDLEMANSRYDLLDRFKVNPFTKEIGYGVLDVHSHRVETKDEVKAGILRGLEVLKSEQMYIDPDCGLKTRTVDEAFAKLQVMVDAVREVREEKGITA